MLTNNNRANNILEVKELGKTYPGVEGDLTVLSGVSFSLSEGETCAIVGPSGSGKTTLLGLSAGLDKPSMGQVILCGINLGDLSEDERAEVRNKYVGFVFQSFQLIPTLTALENIMVPAELRGEKNTKSRALDLLAQVGLADRATHYPTQLSGGEQQRIGLARAFINKPRILFADEPTGNLDGDTGERIESLLFELNQTAGTTLVVVTHNLELAAKTGRVIQLRSGEVVSDKVNKPVGVAS